MKSKYRIRNWRQYNASLIQRGNITVWFSDNAMKNWKASILQKRGRPFVYSDQAIMTALIIRSVFHLSLRSVEGFLRSLCVFLAPELPVPSYTQICRRAAYLGQDLKKLSKKKITDIVIDSTGLKVYGEGEWKVRKHGASKRRTWRKLHLAVCPDSNEILFSLLTENSVSDCEIYKHFLAKAPSSITKSYGDGAYDTSSCYRASFLHGSELIVPPRRNAVYRENTPLHMKSRNEAILSICESSCNEEGRKLWKILNGYHRRSLAETAMFRMKQLFGTNLRSREFCRQRAEVRARSESLNIMTRLGMPRGEWIT